MRFLAAALGICFAVVPCRGLRSVASASPLDDPDTEIARRHFARGAALYEQSRYAEAVAELLAARRAKSMPALDYNIARCYDRLENIPAAIDYYQRYVSSNPPAGLDGGAEERLKVLRARLGSTYTQHEEPVPQRHADPVVATTKRDTAAHAEHYFPVAVPAAVGGVALLSLVTGGALYGVSGSRYNDLVAQGCGSTRACDESTFSGTRSMERAGIGLLVAGGVLAVVDVGLWVAWALPRGKKK